MPPRRRHLVKLGVLPASALLPARAQSGPEGRLVVPFAAGGAADLVARLLAPALAAWAGRPFAVVNLPGRSGQEATAHVARSAPDGLTLLLASNSVFVTAAELCAELRQWNEILRPVGLLACNGLVLCVSAYAQLPDLAALLERARRADTPLAFGSAGFGTTGHIAMEALMQRTGLRLAHLPSDGDALAMRTLMTDRVDCSFCNAATARPLVQAGAARALAVTSPLRLPAFPTVPTLDEAGFPGFQATTDFALFAPIATPATVMRGLVAAALEAVAEPLMRRRLAIAALQPVGIGPQEFDGYLERERAEWRALLNLRGLNANPLNC